MNNFYYGAVGMPQYMMNQQQPVMQQPYQYQNQQMVPFVAVPKEEVEKNRPDIAKFIRDYNDSQKKSFNDHWFQRDDDAIIKGVQDVISSCQRDKYFTLRVLSFRVVKDYESIQRLLWQKYAGRTKNGKKLDNPYDYINLRDSDINLLIVRYYIKINRPEDQIRIDPRTKKPEKLEGEEEIYIMLPRYVNKYYFRIQGNYYAPMFQVVDGSTYNNCTSNSKAQTVTLKTRFMPIKLYREHYDLIDVVSEQTVKCCLYAAYIFAKKVDAVKYLLGRYGFYGAMELLEITDIHIGLSVMNPDYYYNFKCKDKVTIVSVNKILFDGDGMTQSFVFTLQKAIHKYKDWKDIFNPRFWNKSLGSDFMSPTLEKGIPVLDSLESIYDIKTRELIHLPEEDKCDVYHIIRWMMREFGGLRMKDNLDISTKLARMADQYIDCVYAKRLSKGIYRISDKGKSVKYMDVFRAINIQPDFIISTMINKSNLINYVNGVNDNDAEIALEFTYKGISGLGDQDGGNRNAIPDIYRAVHQSHLGRVDLDSSSASDPGLSGTICPMAHDYVDGSFSEYEEPNSWRELYDDILNDYHKLTGMQQAIEIQKTLGLTYDYIKDDMVRETLITYQKLICPIIDLDGKIDYSRNESVEYVIKNNSTNPADDTGDIVIATEDTINCYEDPDSDNFIDNEPLSDDDD